MANIDKNKGMTLLWQGMESACTDPSTFELREFIDVVYSNSGLGTLTDRVTADKFSWEMPMDNFECGHAYIISTTEKNSFNIPGAVEASTGANSNLLTTFYPTEFTIKNKGTFHIISGSATNPSGWLPNAESNPHPMYKTVSGNLYVWFDGSSYAMSNGLGSSSGKITNASCLPNSSYGDGRDPETQTISISGFTGSSSSANGIYDVVGYFNTKPMFRNGSDCSYFYYFDGSKWVLSNNPVFVEGDTCYVSGTSDMFGTLSSNGNCFSGQSGTARDGLIDPRSLATESEQSLLATEDRVAILITEEN